MITIDWKPTDRQLRQFGWASLIGFPLVGYLLLHKAIGLSLDVAMIVGAVGPLTLVLSLIGPRLALPIFVAAMAIALPIGWIVSHLLLRLIYYLLFTPLALWFRIIGRDSMKRRFEPEADSYWIDRPGRRDPASYLRLY